MDTLSTALRYFHEVATSGSITLAAQSLHVTASAISRQISALERQIDSPVFRRHARGMHLTDAGVLLLAHTRRVLADGDQLITDLSDLASETTQAIEVVSSEGLAAFSTSRAIADFCKTTPQASVHLSVLPSAEATSRVIDGTADIATVFSLGPQHDIKVEYSAPAPAFAVVSKDHPLANLPTVSLAAICEYPLSMPARGITQRELFDIATREAGLSPRIVFTTNHINPALEFACSGAGVTLLSQFSKGAHAIDSLVYIPIDHPVLSERSAQILTMPRRRQSDLVRKLINRLAEHLHG